MLISWPPSWIFWKIQKLLKIIQKLIKNIENVFIRFKQSISMKNVKIVKSGFEKVVDMATA